MSLVMHIFKKDIRRLRVFLFIWIPVVMLAATANVVGPSTGNFFLQSIQELIIMFTGFLQFIMMALIVPFLIHSEPLTGTTAFWLTRPLKKTDIMKSKLLFAGTFFVLIPTLINILYLVACQVPATFIFPMMLEYLLQYLGNLLHCHI